MEKLLLLSCLLVVSVLLVGVGCDNVINAADRWLKGQERSVVRHLKLKGQSHLSDTGCDCNQKKYACGCCADFKFPKIGLDDTGCVNVTYLPDQYGISVFVTLDGKVYFNETVSAKNPPPLCFGIPHLEKAASICLDFYNLDYSKATFSGCIKVEARLYHVMVEDLDLGCFKIPLAKTLLTKMINYEENVRDWLLEMKKQQQSKRMMLGFK